MPASSGEGPRPIFGVTNVVTGAGVLSAAAAADEASVDAMSGGFGPRYERRVSTNRSASPANVVTANVTAVPAPGRSAEKLKLPGSCGVPGPGKAGAAGGVGDAVGVAGETV